MADKEAPRMIYLQFGPGVDPGELTESEWDSGEVTWAANRVFDTDVEYVRDDVVARLTQERDEARGEIKRLRVVVERTLPKDALGNPIEFSVYWFWHELLGLCSVRIENIEFGRNGFSVYGTASQCSPCPEVYDATFDDSEDLFPTISDAKSARSRAAEAAKGGE